MADWNGYELYQCKCGFNTLDKGEFEKHIRKPGHADIKPIVLKKTKPAKQAVVEVSVKEETITQEEKNE